MEDLMAKEKGTPQRAYSMRIRPVTEDGYAALWQSHVLMNRGAEAFGHWLLTFKGGLPPSLADSEEDQAVRRQKRILLSLCWLSVESGGNSTLPVVERGELTNALSEILRMRGVTEEDIASWIEDCGATLRCAIRADARWVNRALAFDQEVQAIGDVSQDDIWDLLGPVFGKADALLYLASGEVASVEGTEDDDSKAKVKDSGGKDFAQKTRGWLSNRWGNREGVDFRGVAKAYTAIAACGADLEEDNFTTTRFSESLVRRVAQVFPGDQIEDLAGVRDKIKGSRRPNLVKQTLTSWLNGGTAPTHARALALCEEAGKQAGKAEKNINRKGKKVYSDRMRERICSALGLEYSTNAYSTLFDHAARRASSAWSWIKLAEQTRRDLDADAQVVVSKAALSWLDRYCRDRVEASGAVGEYLINKRAISAWEQVVAEWRSNRNQSVEDRRLAARLLQADHEKFGDIQLFERLAEEDARFLWESGPEDLQNYVRRTSARARQRYYKIPAYRHPDPFMEPLI
jgi:hypothetical protein